MFSSIVSHTYLVFETLEVSVYLDLNNVFLSFYDLSPYKVTKPKPIILQELNHRVGHDNLRTTGD